MKPTTKAALLGAIVATAAIIIVSPLAPSNAQAQVPGGEEYKIVSTPQWPGRQLEAELNRLGTRGWKVRAGVENIIILAK
jgi:hypothetical protein